MLNALRTGAKSPLAKTLFFILIAGFLLWGVGDMVVRQGGAGVAVEVGGEEISAAELQQRLVSAAQQRGMTPAQASERGILDMILQQTVEDTVLALEAREMGIAVSDGMILRQLRDNPAFRDANGAFNRERYSQALASQGLTEARFEGMLRRQAARELLLDAVGEAVIAPSTLVEPLRRIEEERRVATYLAIDPSKQTVTAEPDQETLQAIHDANKGLFTVPEKRALSVLHVTEADLAKKLVPADDELRKIYEERIESVRSPEKRRFQQLLFAEEEKARQAAERLRAGEDAAEVAKAVGGSAPITVGPMDKATIPAPTLADAVFAQDPNSFGAPVQSTLGWHVLKVTEVVPAGQRTFEEVKEELGRQIAAERAVDRLPETIVEAENRIGGGDALPAVAGAVGVDVLTVPDFSGAEGTNLPQPLAASEEFRTTVMALREGETSALRPMDNGFFVARVDGITPARVKPLEEVREEVVQRWRNREQRKLAEQKAEALAAKLKSGATIEAVAAEEGLEVRVSEPFGIQGGPEIPRPLAGPLFTGQVGAVATGANREGILVARLSEVREPPAGEAGNAERWNEAVGRLLAQEIQAAYLQGLRERYPARVDAELLREISGATAR